MKAVCRDLMYCVQYYREECNCPMIVVQDCGNFEQKLYEYGNGLGKHDSWRKERIDRYFENKKMTALKFSDIQKGLDSI